MWVDTLKQEIFSVGMDKQKFEKRRQVETNSIFRQLQVTKNQTQVRQS